MKKLSTLVAALLFLGSLSASADSLICSYVARLSARDHRASDGYPLRDVAAIIRQDRANFHKFGVRDSEDESDTFFNSVKNRESLESMLRRRRFNPSIASAIINGNPLVQVDVMQANEGFIYITLTLL